MAQAQFSNFTSPNTYFAWYLGGNNNPSQNQKGVLQIQMDIVGFLAILGEGSVLSNAQVASLSWFVYLPRLMPAPQALLRTSRPDNLAPHNGHTSSVYSGNIRHHINHVGHILAEAERYPQHSVRCVRIQRLYRTPSGKLYTEDLHKTSEKERADKNITTSDFTLTAKAWGPLGLVALTGCAFSLILFALALWRTDGFAMLANIMLSSLSSLVGYSGKWKLNLQKRANRGRYTPPGDVVIRYDKGNFLIVSCDEDVARELYFAPEGINYLVKNQWQYRVISLLGTIMLMFGVIFLANSSTWMQLCFAVAYITMNALYWIVAALPSRVHWDTSCFKVSDQAIEVRVDTGVPPAAKPATKPPAKGGSKKGDVKQATEEKTQAAEVTAQVKVTPPTTLPQKLPGHTTKFVDRNPTYTWALWKAILVTQTTDWVKGSDAAPDTPAWNEWLEQAKLMARSVDPDATYAHLFDGDEKRTLVYRLPDWNPQMYLQECLERHECDVEKGEPPSNRAATIEAIESEG